MPWVKILAQQPQEQLEPGVLAPGQMFEGKFEIISVLGQGGMGVVYKARHTHMNKLVALKTMMLSVVSDDEESFRRFVQEAQAASSLDHANIVRILDFDKTSTGMAYLVMEYLGSVSLEDLLGSHAYLDVDHFLRIAVQICEGLHHAHRKNIVHRDIKPSNIMLAENADSKEIVKIVDFGMAKLTAMDNQQHLTKTGTIVGTPLFMSPEQCRGLDLDHRSDIYSLGCVMYAMLTGKVPFKGSTALDTLYKHATEAPPHFAAVNPGINLPPRLEQAILKSLQKEPANRQQSMIELRNDITDAIFYRSYNTGSVDFPVQTGTQTPVPKSAPDDQNLSKTLNISQNTFAYAKRASVEDEHSNSLIIPKKTAQLAGVGVGAALIAVAAAAVFMMTRQSAPPVVSTAPKQEIAAPVTPPVATATEAPVAPPVPSSPATSPAPKETVKVKKAEPPVKVAAAVPHPKASAQPGTDKGAILKQAHDFSADAHRQMIQHNFGAAELLFANSISFQSKVYGNSDSRIFPDLAHMIACQLAEKKDAEVTRNLLWALQIFNSRKEQVHSLVSKNPQSQSIWWPLARASHLVAEHSQGAARTEYMQWSKAFYDLTRANTGNLPPDKVQAIDKQYTALLTELARGDSNNNNSAQATKAAPAPAHHSHTERHGRMRIWTR